MFPLSEKATEHCDVIYLQELLNKTAFKNQLHKIEPFPFPSNSMAKVFFLIISAFQNIIFNSTIIFQVEFMHFKANMGRTFLQQQSGHSLSP